MTRAPHHARALVALLRAPGPLSTVQVARELGTSVTTARDALDRLEHQGAVARFWDARAGWSVWRLPMLSQGGSGAVQGVQGASR